MRRKSPREKTTIGAHADLDDGGRPIPRRRRGPRATLVALLTGVALLAASSAGTAPGDLDPTFGTGGLVTTDFFGGGEVAREIVVQDDGKLVAAGFTGAAAGALDFALARYEIDGSLDLSFGTGGLVNHRPRGRRRGLRPRGAGRRQDRGGGALHHRRRR